MFACYISEKDGFDGQDLLAIAQDAEELKQSYPIIKERLKFKKLIAMNNEPRDDTSSLRIPRRDNPKIFGKSEKY